MDQSPTVDALVRAARDGDEAAWERIVDRFLPMVNGVIRRFRLSDADADDVLMTVWLRLVEHLGELREPRALPGWLITTTHREALRVIRARSRTLPTDPQGAAFDDVVIDLDLEATIVRQARAQALREALLELPPQRRELLELLLINPPMSYQDISTKLGIPIGSIGPTRARALAQLRRTRALRDWADCVPEQGQGEHDEPQ